jgi:hypothetical protein
MKRAIFRHVGIFPAIAVGLIASSAYGQSRPVCSLVTADEAATVLGARTAPRSDMPDFECTYFVSNVLQMVAEVQTGDAARQNFTGIRADAAKQGVTWRATPSLGPQAYCSSGSEPSGEKTTACMVLKGGRLFIAIVSDKRRGGPSQLLDKLIPVVRKAVARM